MGIQLNNNQKSEVVSKVETLGLDLTDQFRGRESLGHEGKGEKHILIFEDPRGAEWQFGKFVPEQGKTKYFGMAPGNQLMFTETNFSDGIDQFEEFISDMI